MPKRTSRKIPPGKRGIFAELPEDLVAAVRKRADDHSRIFRKELELALRHWLTMPRGFLPDNDLPEAAAPNKRGRKRKDQ